MIAWQLLRLAAPQLTSLPQWKGLAPLSVGLATRLASSDSAAVIVPMPKLSPSMTEGTVSKWLKVRMRHALCHAVQACKHDGHAMPAGAG